jgi:molecular chaperone Hsp33
MSDSLHRFMLSAAQVRGQVVSLAEQWREILARHPNLPVLVQTQLGELTAAGILLAATLKFDGTVILQISGDGPLALMIVEVETDQSFRATVKLRENQEAQLSAATDLQSLANTKGEGRFALTLAPHTTDMSPYQGMISLDQPSIAAAIEEYMQRSEQVPTRLQLAADDQQAAGLLLQRLPDHGGSAKDGAQLALPDADGWNRMVTLADTLTGDELRTLEPQQIVHRLFWEQSLSSFEERYYRFRCRCSREKVTGMLQMLGQEEVDSIIADLGHVQVNCEFCNTQYRFDAVDVKTLFLPNPDTRLNPASPKLQ